MSVDLGTTNPVPASPSPVLAVEGVRVRFRGVVALDGVDLDVAAGEVVGLVGANGAGKTTLFNVITGLQTAESGSVHFAGRNISRDCAHRRARYGIARTFQRMNLVDQLSVLDNILLGAELHRGFLRVSGLALPSNRRHEHEALSRVEEVVASLELDRDVALRAADLPTGKRRLVEVARALATRPRLLLLDEPSAGLDEHEAARFSRIVADWVAKDDFGVVIVEHDIELVSGLANRISVLDQGRVLASGPPAQVLFDPEVRRAFIGGVSVG
jgi:branched-chain amino acid transport system ATP-binding protein